MKSKLSWIPFIILLPVAAFFRFAPSFFAEGSVLGKGSIVPDYLFLAAIVLIFLFSVIFCALDSRISPYYLRRRNIASGIVGVLLAVCFAAEGTYKLFTSFGSGKAEPLPVAEGILAVLSAVVMITMSLTVMFRGRENKPASLLCIFPAVLFAVRMVSCFVSFTTISLRFADVTALCCYIFATLFFYHYAVTLSVIESKTGVKNCFVFGLPAAASMFACGVFKLVFSFDTSNVLSNLIPLEMVLVALFIVLFLIEVSRHAVEREKTTVIGIDDEEPEEKPVSEEKADGFLVSVSDENETENEETLEYLNTADTSGYLYQEVKRDEPEDENISRDVDDYLTSYSDLTENDDRPKDYASRLDEIDKLILEIAEKSD